MAVISFDERRLYVSDCDLTVRLYSGPGFVNQSAASIDHSQDLSTGKRRYTVRELMTSTTAQYVVVLRYHDSGTVGGAARYTYVDLFAGRRGETITTPNGVELEDISRDCRVGVDDQLALYDMIDGQVKLKLSVAQENKSARVQVKDPNYL